MEEDRVNNGKENYYEWIIRMMNESLCIRSKKQKRDPPLRIGTYRV